MKKSIIVTEDQLSRVLELVSEEKNLQEGPLDALQNMYRGVKGMKRGYGYDYFQNMSKLQKLIQTLKKLDQPNNKVIKELQSLRAKVSSLGMPQQRKDAILALIDNSVFHFNKYNSINDQILQQIKTLNIDKWS